MKDLDVGDATLRKPNDVGFIIVDVLCEDGTYLNVGEVSFRQLQKWVASAKEPSNTRMQTDACQCKYPYPDTINKFSGPVCAACGRPRR